MFDKLTPEAKDALNAARRVAYDFGHLELRPEHIAIGVLATPACLAARMLENLRVKAEDVRADVERTLVRGGTPQAGQIPMTEDARHVLGLALRESRELDHAIVGTGHLLLGLAGSLGSVPSRVLAERGVGPLELHAMLESNSGVDDDPDPELDTTGWRVEALRRAIVVLRATGRDSIADAVERAAQDLS